MFSIVVFSIMIQIYTTKSIYLVYFIYLPTIYLIISDKIFRLLLFYINLSHYRNLSRIFVLLHFMKVNILAFGIAKDIFGGSAISVELTNDATISNLKYLLEHRYPKLQKLATYMIAVNNEYALDGDTVHERDEIAIIPPVSGG